jgi:hypothetical protein
MKIFSTFMGYLRERQTPFIMYLHLAILTLVLSQIIVSNFMEFTDSGEISDNTIEFYGTWLHIISGLFIIPITLVFITVLLKQNGFKYYFPYLKGDLSQLKSDINQLMKLELPEPSAYGIAAVIQGLGIGALFLVLFSGLTWFLSWNYNISWSSDVKETHEFLTGLVQAYIIGHGSMGVLHIYFRSKL